MNVDKEIAEAKASIARARSLLGIPKGTTPKPRAAHNDIEGMREMRALAGTAPKPRIQTVKADLGERRREFPAAITKAEAKRVLERNGAET